MKRHTDMQALLLVNQAMRILPSPQCHKNGKRTLQKHNKHWLHSPIHQQAPHKIDGTWCPAIQLRWIKFHPRYVII
jgi:hypothetical protein